MKDYYLLTLTIYNFDKKKIKFDYSVNPLENIKEENNEILFKSKTSEDQFNFNKKTLLNPIFSNKDSKGHKISRVQKLFIIDKPFEEKEKDINFEMYRLFNKHFFFKFKHRKLLNKKILLKQFLI